MSVVARQALLNAATRRPWRADHGQVSRVGTAESDIFSVDCSYESDAAAAEAHADVDLVVAAVNEYESLLACEAGLRAIVGYLPVGNGYVRHALEAIERLDKIRAQS